MPSKMRTTVILTEKARHIKNRLAPAFGLKGILSVGVELFEKLPDDKKISRVAEAIRSDKAGFSKKTGKKS